MSTQQCCCCYKEGKYFYIGGYIDDRFRAGYVPEYARPGWVEPGMGGLPQVNVESMQLESSIIVALRNDEKK